MKTWFWVECCGEWYIYEESTTAHDGPFATFPDETEKAIKGIVDRHNNEILACRAEIARIQAQNHGGQNYVGGA